VRAAARRKAYARAVQPPSAAGKLRVTGRHRLTSPLPRLTPERKAQAGRGRRQTCLQVRRRVRVLSSLRAKAFLHPHPRVTAFFSARLREPAHFEVCSLAEPRQKERRAACPCMLPSIAGEGKSESPRRGFAKVSAGITLTDEPLSLPFTARQGKSWFASSSIRWAIPSARSASRIFCRARLK
jgi:hypothetical protein